MSAYEAYAEEKQRLDALVEEGRLIEEIREDLDGAVIRFSAAPGAARGTGEDAALGLRIGTADARKHAAVLLIRQLAVGEAGGEAD
ncbi:hypothetical protein ACTHPH_02435 [Paenibacillus pasadenensis]|uniref:Uncharacterized protein n=1 Tax=Paenibacillus pasadenensis TaxID=217090 RepID=A0A2N5N6T2_9BACL|nr:MULTISPECIES: hypothetical protein [Paenibacillus]PLT46025.1 hypothetical protein B8V81_4456 [Paenibacillus pasadenensis]QGG56511.1 hypothetical protein GE073_13575 [Paenibacillus sp. B01]